MQKQTSAFTNTATSAPRPLFGTRCVDGKGRRTTHPAEGYIVAPDGDRIGVMCQREAQEVIAEYAEKLGQAWTFEPVSDDANTGATVSGAVGS